MKQLGFRAHPLPGAQRTAIGITGNQGEVDRGNLEELSGVAEVIRVSKAYKLASRDVKEEDTVVRFAGTDATIGGRKLAIVAGPCSIESREQAFAIAEQVAAAGAQFFRGGAYKPRTSPYAFQGLGLEALNIMAEIRDRFGLRIVTEAIDNETLDLVAEWADVIQIGARNMQNFSLLKHAGRLRKPVLLKRGMTATLDEFLMAAEYIMSEGNYEVILCERGVRTFADHTRNTLDLSIVPAVQRLSHLPILVDPSHGTGKRDSDSAHGARCRRGRLRRYPRRSPSPAREGALRRTAVHLSRSVCAHDGRDRADCAHRPSQAAAWNSYRNRPSGPACRQNQVTRPGCPSLARPPNAGCSMSRF